MLVDVSLILLDGVRLTVLVDVWLIIPLVEVRLTLLVDVMLTMLADV